MLGLRMMQDRERANNPNYDQEVAARNAARRQRRQLFDIALDFARNQAAAQVAPPPPPAAVARQAPRRRS